MAVRLRGELVRLFAWADLRPEDRELDPAAVGRTVAALHRAGGWRRARCRPWFWQPVGPERWTGLGRDLDAAGAPFAADVSALVDVLTRSESIMRSPAPPLLLAHRDLWADNVRAGPDGQVVVVDWDECGPASADQELAMVLVEFGTTAERARQLYRAYCGAGGPGRRSPPAGSARRRRPPRAPRRSVAWLSRIPGPTMRRPT